MKKQNGITLIALVISIIVLLILAGVTINLILGQDGILNRAQKAAQEYTQAQNQEMADLDAFTNKIDKIASGRIYYVTDNNGNAIPVPKGFSPITASEQGTKENGFVIKNDKDGNEFVWVPVTNYERVGWTRDEWENRQTLDEKTGRITRVDLEEKTNYWIETVPADEQKSVSTYGGFYIGRYETGIKDYDTKDTTREEPLTTVWTAYTGDDTRLVIQYDQQVWNWITRDKAKMLSENLYDEDTDNVISKLCSSYAWDSALKFIETQNSTYPTNSTGGSYDTAEGENGKQQRTGYHGVNNIFDMGGNVWEWTTEYCSIDDQEYAVARGGGFTYSAVEYPAAARGKSETTYAKSYGFRIALFM